MRINQIKLPEFIVCRIVGNVSLSSHEILIHIPDSPNHEHRDIVLYTLLSPNLFKAH